MSEPNQAKGHEPILATPLAVLAALLPVHHNANHHQRHHHHHPGCRTLTCDLKVGKAWWVKHHPTPRFQFGSFELCVANRESGSPGSYSYSTIDWQFNGEYEGAYNWVNSTWLAEGGGRYAEHAYDATPEEQTLIFRAHENPRDWPNTVPACGG